MSTGITDNLPHPGTVERAILEYRFSVRYVASLQNGKNRIWRTPEPATFRKADGNAVIVCGGEHEMDAALKQLFDGYVRHNRDGHVIGLPESVDAYFLGDKEAFAPVRPFLFCFEYDRMQDHADIELTPRSAVFGEEWTVITYDLEAA